MRFSRHTPRGEEFNENAVAHVGAAARERTSYRGRARRPSLTFSETQLVIYVRHDRCPWQAGSFVHRSATVFAPEPRTLSWFKTRTRMMNRRESGDELVLWSTNFEVEKCTR